MGVILGVVVWGFRLLTNLCYFTANHLLAMSKASLKGSLEMLFRGLRLGSLSAVGPAVYGHGKNLPAGPLLFLGDVARPKKAAGVGYTRYDTADDVEEYLCSSLQELETPSLLVPSNITAYRPHCFNPANRRLCIPKWRDDCRGSLANPCIKARMLHKRPAMLWSWSRS